MAYDIEYAKGGIIAVTTAAQTVKIPKDDRPYSFRNKGPARVFLKLDATTGVVTTAAASQFLLDADENFTVPAGVTYVSVATAAGTAILLMARGNYEQRLY